MQTAALVLYFAGPFLLLRADRVWGVPLAILSLWLPVELGLFRYLDVPAWIALTVGMLAGVLAFRSRRDVMDVSAAFDFRRLDIRRATLSFVIFSVIAIPLGLAIGFITPVFRAPLWTNLPATIASILVFNALPEEILFRGVIQHSLESRLKNKVLSLLMAALIFGASHLNNGPVLPNYKYCLMASIAGVFYGLAWRARKSVLTSTVTHTLVNLGWLLFFR